MSHAMALRRFGQSEYLCKSCHETAGLTAGFNFLNSTPSGGLTIEDECGRCMQLCRNVEQTNQADTPLDARLAILSSDGRVSAVTVWYIRG